MIIAVLNYSGNVGKTIVSRDVLKLGFKLLKNEEYKILSVESYNEDGKEELIINGKKQDEIFLELLMNDNLILDVGSSNIEQFINMINDNDEILDKIDRWVIPSTKESKIQVDTTKTIAVLRQMNVPNNKIKIVLNKASNEEEIKDQYHYLHSFKTKTKSGEIVYPPIYHHQLYNQAQQLDDLIVNIDYSKEVEKAKLAVLENNKSEASIAELKKMSIAYIRQKKVTALLGTYHDIFCSIIDNENEHLEDE